MESGPPFKRIKAVAPQQMGRLAFYRYEQPLVDYCQAHQPLHISMGFDPPAQAVEGRGARERSIAPNSSLLPSMPVASSISLPQ
ncbi:hypothetical protein MHYP_G00321430 [Metynnis hypsauchen]